MNTFFLVLAVALTGTLADVSHLSGIQTVLQEDGYHYDKPSKPFPPPPSVDKKEEYLPPPPQPLCRNGSPDSSFPDCCANGGRGKYCCANGANNEYCCSGPYVNPTCSAPTTRYNPPVTTPRYVPPPPPPPPKPLCDNGAPDFSYPDCCENGGRGRFCCANGANNEYCCSGPYVNPTCSAPPPPPPPPKQPLCSNGAPDRSYPDCCENGGRGPFCCANGASNEYCCSGPYVNPTCSAPPAPTTTRYIPPVTTPRYVPPPPPPPPKPLCDNRAPDSSYPYCCSNGARNEFCCTGPYVNPTCSPPATTQAPIYLPPETTQRYVPPPPPPPRQPLCKNGASDSSYPDCCTNGGRGKYCCENGANNEYCCSGRYVNPTCSPPPPPPVITTQRYVPPPTPPPPRKPLCDNGASDSSYPDCCTNGGRGQYCCANGANNEYCCSGPYVNPTCSAPPPPPPPPRQPLCKNGASDSSYPDCCTNGGRGKYCCANGANNEYCCSGAYVNPTCSPPPKVEVEEQYLPPCGNGGIGPNCETSNGYNYDRPSVAFRY